MQKIQEWLEAGRRVDRHAVAGVRGKQSQLGRRRVVEKCLGPIEIRHFKCRGAFTQHRFQRGFPALIDVQLLPQARQFAQLVLLQPGLHFALALHAFLQLLQGRQTCFQLRVVGGFGVDLLLRATALFFQFRLLLLRGFELPAGLFQRHLLFFQLHLQVGEMRAVRQVQAALLLRQSLAAHGQAGQDIRRVALMRGFELDLLLDLHDLAARLGGLQLRLTPRLLQRRQAVVLLVRGFLRLLDPHRMLFQMHFGFAQIVLVLLALALPLVALDLQ